MDRAFYISLGLFCLLFAVMSISDLKLVWMSPICGYAAGVCGVICFFSAFHRGPKPG